jgi:hypothetical protein
MCELHEKQLNLQGYPELLAELMAETEAEIDELYDALLFYVSTLQELDEEEIEREVQSWEDNMIFILARFTMASFMLGAGTALVSASYWQQIVGMLEKQYNYLANFSVDIANRILTGVGLDPLKWRAEMYAQSITEAYWRGINRERPELPDYPGSGNTECLTRCRCEWLWDMEDPDNGNWDVTWRLGIAEESCPTCLARAARWNPLKIRDWEIINE